MDHSAVLLQFETAAGRCIADTGLPGMFVDADSAAARAAAPPPCTDTKLPESASHVAMPAVREVPYEAFTADELWAPRPSTLAPGFYMRRTPAEMAKDSTRKDSWAPNMWKLRMGPGYRELILRNVRNAEPLPPHVALPVDEHGEPQSLHTFLYAEFIFGAYCIAFHRRVLDQPGVQFYPLFVPAVHGDINWWAKHDITLDAVASVNTVPPVPPGVYIPFERLSGEVAVTKERVIGGAPGEYVLTSRVPEHPVVQGKLVFPVPAKNGMAVRVTESRKEGQDGSVGYVVFRPNLVAKGIMQEVDQPGQPFVLYARCAYGPSALANIDVQRSRVAAALAYALNNLPEPGVVMLDGVHAGAAGSSLGNFGTLAMFDARTFGDEVGSWNVVASNEDAHVERNLRRWLAYEHPDLDADALAAEARFRLRFAAAYDPAWIAAPSVRIVLGGAQSRTFIADEFAGVLDMVGQARTQVRAWSADCACSPALHFMAPPDEERFGDLPVVCVGMVLRVRFGVTATTDFNTADRPAVSRLYKAYSDYGTRIMWDMMLYDPQLQVVASAHETCVNFMTDKAPGILNVQSAKFGTPQKTTCTSVSRRVRDPTPAMVGFVVETCDATSSGVDAAGLLDDAAAATAPPRGRPEHAVALPNVHAPPLSRDAAASNPLLQLWIRGPPRPSSVPGVETSIYRPGTKCTSTHFAGTSHSWPAYGGYVDMCLRKPKCAQFPMGLFDRAVDDDARAAAVDILYPPLYNTVKGQVWSNSGNWRSPDFQPRAWQNAYGVCASILHRAMAFLLYPAFAQEYTSPTSMRVWELKQACESVMHFMSRYGRLVRGVLVNRRRSVRNDFQQQSLNDVWYVRRHVPADAPVADVIVSAYNALRHNLIVGDSPRRGRNAYDSQTNPGLGLDGPATSSAAAVSDARDADDEFVDTDVPEDVPAAAAAAAAANNTWSQWYDDGGAAAVSESSIANLMTIDDLEAEEELCGLAEDAINYRGAFVPTARSVIGEVEQWGPTTQDLFNELSAHFTD